VERCEGLLRHHQSRPTQRASGLRVHRTHGTHSIAGIAGWHPRRLLSHIRGKRPYPCRVGCTLLPAAEEMENRRRRGRLRHATATGTRHVHGRVRMVRPDSTGGGGASQTWLAVNARHVGRWGRARTCVLSRKLRSLAPALALVSVRVLWMVERIVLMALLEVEPPFTGEPGEFLP
jgi:hypothetical protein